ncbi:TPR repeat-containing protein precursor, partial [Haemophilus influenzae]
ISKLEKYFKVVN